MTDKDLNDLRATYKQLGIILARYDKPAPSGQKGTAKDLKQELAAMLAPSDGSPEERPDSTLLAGIDLAEV